jgi:serine protease Do
MPNRLNHRSESPAPRPFPVSRFFLMVCLLTGISGISHAGEKNLDSELQLSGVRMRKVFAPAVSDAHTSTVEMWCRGKQVALGTVIDDEGHILSKASELQSEVHCRFPDGDEVRAKLLAIDRKYDLALLHVDRDELTPAVWAEEDLREIGRWVITAGIDETPLAVGVSSVERISIARPGGTGELGVHFYDSEKRPTISYVSPFSAAARCGLQVGDVILQMADRVVESTESWNHSMRRYHPGDTFFLRVLRDNKEYLNFQVTLDADFKKRIGDRQSMQNRMGAKLSTRRADFKNVFQHDTVLSSNQCGGPLVNLKGEIIGMNIARGGRTESYAIPVSILKQRIEELHSGRLAVVLPDHRLPVTELVSQQVESSETEYPPPPPLAMD